MQNDIMTRHASELSLFPLGTILWRMLPVALAAMLMLSLIVEPWDLGKWSGVPPERIAVFAAFLFICGLLAAGLIQWEHRKERRRDIEKIPDDKAQ